MKAAMVLTAEPDQAFSVARQLREGMPEASWLAFVRDDDREALLPALVGCRICSDKPRGSKLAFLRDLRRQRIDVAFVAWHGGERPQPMKLAILFVGAKDVTAIDETGRAFAVQWWAPWTWGGHAIRRLGQMRVLRVLRLFASTYRRTLGALARAVVLLPEMVRLRRLPRPRA